MPVDLYGVLLAMTASLSHRGPDDDGLWFDNSKPFGLGHRRLSILELSPLGHQPMQSLDGRWVLSFNGEIYNHQELRRSLAKEGRCVSWRGGSDTETLLDCVAAWGLPHTLKAAVGMFALAVWNKQTKSLFLARDRFGEKPLYLGWNSGRFAFASELKAIKTAFRNNLSIDADALRQYFLFGFIPAPLSIYEGICKLLPGHYCIIDEQSHFIEKFEQIPYWSLSSLIEKRESTRSKWNSSTYDEAKSELTRLLEKAVLSQMQSEVPLGAFLSGGLDSSTVVALMASLSSKKIRTFTVSVDEAEFNEGKVARDTAEILGTDHTDIRLFTSELMSSILRMPETFDEPFADPSQVLTHIISRVASQHISVALTGDGGDELLGGYHRHYTQNSFERLLYALPPALKALAVEVFLLIPPSLIKASVKFLSLSKYNHDGLEQKLRDMLVRVKLATSDLEYYFLLISNGPYFRESKALAIYNRNPLFFRNLCTNIEELGERMMHFDSLFYLPDDILCKVDRASMAFSLETRSPFLDKDLVEFAWTLPFDFKVSRNQGKQMLRDILISRSLKHIVSRKKSGFVFPLATYLRGPLKAWVEDTLSTDQLNRCPYISKQSIRELWQIHLSGKVDHGTQLWRVLMFIGWQQSQQRD